MYSHHACCAPAAAAVRAPIRAHNDSLALAKCYKGVHRMAPRINRPPNQTHLLRSHSGSGACTHLALPDTLQLLNLPLIPAAVR